MLLTKANIKQVQNTTKTTGGRWTEASWLLGSHKLCFTIEWNEMRGVSAAWEGWNQTNKISNGTYSWMQSQHKGDFFFFSFLKEAQQRRTGTILIQETNIALRSRVQLHMCLKPFIRQSYRLRREKATLTLLSLSSTLPLPAAFSLVTWPLSWLPTHLASVPFPAPDLENLHLLVIQSSCDSETCTL